VGTAAITAESLDVYPADAELSDAALDALAQLLIDDALQNEEITSPAVVRANKNGRTPRQRDTAISERKDECILQESAGV
jgi:hypothetical protein